MKGSSTLTINKATMMEALEHWLNDAVVMPSVKVTNVTPNVGQLNFDVTFERAVADDDADR